MPYPHRTGQLRLASEPPAADRARRLPRSNAPLGRPLTAADVLTAGEVAALLRVPRSTVEDWARRGVIPSRKVGRRRLYLRPSIETLLLDDGAEHGVQGG
jgi:excisionase family DNA binding protein